VLEGRVEVTIGKEEHKFQEGPFSCFGEHMLDQALLVPSSPHVNANIQENNAKNLRKSLTSTPANNNTDISGRRQEPPLPLPLNRQTWAPDYSLRAVTDVVYLKIRKNTYLVAIKASRMNNMNSEVEGNIMKEQELEEYLQKMTENDADFTGITPNIMSPDNLWPGEAKVTSLAGTPTEFRRESIRSSLSMMKQKIFGTGAGMGRSCTSIDKPNRDDFWDGMTNPALTTSKDDIAVTQDIVASPPGVTELNKDHQIKVGNNTTVISVRGSGAGRDNTEQTDTREDISRTNTREDNSRTNSVNKEDMESPVS